MLLPLVSSRSRPRFQCLISHLSLHNNQLLGDVLDNSGHLRTYLLGQFFRSSQASSTTRELIHLHSISLHGLYRAAAKSRQMFLWWNMWTSILALCEVSKPSIIVVFILGIDLGQLLKVELVPQHSANATKAFDELVAFA